MKELVDVILNMDFEFESEASSASRRIQSLVCF